MIFGGVLERFPKLKVCFAHGGKICGRLKCFRMGCLNICYPGQEGKPGETAQAVCCMICEAESLLWTWR